MTRDELQQTGAAAALRARQLGLNEHDGLSAFDPYERDRQAAVDALRIAKQCQDEWRIGFVAMYRQEGA
jgi:hypothetical protein